MAASPATTGTYGAGVDQRIDKVLETTGLNKKIGNVKSLKPKIIAIGIAAIVVMGVAMVVSSSTATHLKHVIGAGGCKDNDHLTTAYKLSWNAAVVYGLITGGCIIGLGLIFFGMSKRSAKRATSP